MLVSQFFYFKENLNHMWLSFELFSTGFNIKHYLSLLLDSPWTPPIFHHLPFFPSPSFLPPSILPSPCPQLPVSFPLHPTPNFSQFLFLFSILLRDISRQTVLSTHRTWVFLMFPAFVHSQSKPVCRMYCSKVEVGVPNFSFPFSVPLMALWFPELKQAEEESASR